MGECAEGPSTPQAPFFHCFPRVISQAQCLPRQLLSNATSLPSSGHHLHSAPYMYSGSCWVAKGALPPARSHSRVQAGLCLSFWGLIFYLESGGVVRTVPTCGVSGGLTQPCAQSKSKWWFCCLQAEGPGEVGGSKTWSWTAQVPLGQGVGPAVGQLWSPLRQPTVASIPATWDMQPCQGPSLPTAAPETQPGP